MKNKDLYDSIYSKIKEEFQFKFIRLNEKDYVFKCPVCGETSDKSLVIFNFISNKGFIYQGDGRKLDPLIGRKKIEDSLFTLSKFEKTTKIYESAKYKCHNECDLEHLANLFMDKIEDKINIIESNGWGHVSSWPTSLSYKFLIKHKKLEMP